MCSIGLDGKSLDLDWGQGKVTQLSSVWLRDNSPHPDNIDSVSWGRKLLMSDLDTGVRVAKVNNYQPSS